jgi:hypothetical protein
MLNQVRALGANPVTGVFFRDLAIQLDGRRDVGIALRRSAKSAIDIHWQEIERHVLSAAK